MPHAALKRHNLPKPHQKKELTDCAGLMPHAALKLQKFIRIVVCPTHCAGLMPHAALKQHPTTRLRLRHQVLRRANAACGIETGCFHPNKSFTNKLRRVNAACGIETLQDRCHFPKVNGNCAGQVLFVAMKSKNTRHYT